MVWARGRWPNLFGRRLLQRRDRDGCRPTQRRGTEYSKRDPRAVVLRFCRILESWPFSCATNLMHVLLINQFYWPDTAATGQFLTDVTREIDPNVHEVTVLCGTSDYGAVDMDCPPRVKISRSRGVAFSRNKVGRVISYASFFASAA